MRGTGIRFNRARNGNNLPERTTLHDNICFCLVKPTRDQCADPIYTMLRANMPTWHKLLTCTGLETRFTWAKSSVRFAMLCLVWFLTNHQLVGVLFLLPWAGTTRAQALLVAINSQLVNIINSTTAQRFLASYMRKEFSLENLDFYQRASNLEGLHGLPRAREPFLSAEVLM